MKYEKTDIDNLLQFIRRENAPLLYQDSNSLYLIHKLSNGNYALLPPVGQYGLLVYEEEDVKKLFESGDIPLHEEFPNPFQLNREKFKDFNGNVDAFLNELGRALGMTIDINNVDSAYYAEISNRINVMAKDKVETLFVPLGVFVGEKIRVETGAEWTLEKRYGYNVYYEPVLYGNNKKYFPWLKLLEMLNRRKKFSFREYLSFASEGFETK